MNLTELQIQLRSIEEHISDLQKEIEKMKPQPEDEKKAMFEKITEMASKFPLESRRFSKELNVNIKAYISCLVHILLADDSKIYDGLLFLCRLSYGMGLHMSAEDLVRLGMNMDQKYFNKACSDLKAQKYSFLVDAFMLVNITGECSETSFRLIADMAMILECDKEELCVAAMVAKAVLVEDLNVLKQIPVPSQTYWMGQFRHHIPASWIESLRVKCVSLNTARYLSNSSGDEINPYIIKKKIHFGAIVKKGDELVTYGKERSMFSKQKLVAYFNLHYGTASRDDTREYKTILSPCDGVVFFIEYEKKSTVSGYLEQFLDVYVVSYFDNYDDFCDWHKKI